VVGNNLREHLDDVRRNRRLNRLVTDVELPLGPSEIEMRPLDAQAVRDIFARLEFRTLLNRVFEAVDSDEEAPTSEVITARSVTADDAAVWLSGVQGPVAVSFTVTNGTLVRLGFATATEA